MKALLLSSLLVASAVAGLGGSAEAAAIITSGNVQLGVDNLGQLNIPGGTLSAQGTTSYVGLRYVPTNNEATADGCLCEGWGVAGNGLSGYANNSVGIGGLSLVSFTPTATTAKSIVSAAGGTLLVTHDFAPSVSADLYKVTVTITNTGTDAISNLLYRRTMDWDIEPTAFNEYVTIGGTAAASAVLAANDNGFSSSNPLISSGPLLASGDFVDSGPADHGANFDFQFGTLGVGDTKTFSIFYGGAATEAEAFDALNAVGAEVYSFGQSVNNKDGEAEDGYDTAIFAFAGVGGVVVPPSTVPLPASVWLFGVAVTGLGFASRFAKKRSDIQAA